MTKGKYKKVLAHECIITVVTTSDMTLEKRHILEVTLINSRHHYINSSTPSTMTTTIARFANDHDDDDDDGYTIMIMIPCQE